MLDASDLFDLKAVENEFFKRHELTLDDVKPYVNHLEECVAIPVYDAAIRCIDKRDPAKRREMMREERRFKAARCFCRSGNIKAIIAVDGEEYNVLFKPCHNWADNRFYYSLVCTIETNGYWSPTITTNEEAAQKMAREIRSN